MQKIERNNNLAQTPLRFLAVEGVLPVEGITDSGKGGKNVDQITISFKVIFRNGFISNNFKIHQNVGVDLLLCWILKNNQIRTRKQIN